MVVAVAVVVEIPTYLENVTIVTLECAQVIYDEGISSFDSLIEFDNEDMKTLSSTILRSGGMIANPDAVVQEQPAEIHNSGIVIYMIAEKCLVLIS